VVVPVFDEVDNVAPLAAEIAGAFVGRGPFELIFVDDGSGDGTAEALARLRREDRRVRVIRHRRNAGQTAAIYSGALAARGDWIVTLDGDGQNDPADIGALLAARDRDGGPDLQLVNGIRRRRQDTLAKRLGSRLANRLRRRVLADGSVDTCCGLKLFRRESFLTLPVFDHMHRFLPALFQRQGGRVIAVDVNHRPRRSGASSYGLLDRALVGVADLAGVLWLSRRAGPLRTPSDEVDA